MSNPWFRCYADIADNYKLKMLAFEDRWHYIAILSCKCLGMLDGKRHDFVMRTVAARLGLSRNELEEVSRRLSENYLIDEKTLQPIGWDDRQFVSDNSTPRVRKCRNKKGTGNVSETLQKQASNVSETDQIQNRTETDTDTGKKRFHAVSFLHKHQVPVQLASDFLSIRKAKRAANTQTTFDTLVSEAEIAGIKFPDAIQFAVKKGWARFEAEWFANQKESVQQFKGNEV